MPAVWRNVGHTLIAGAFAATVASSTFADGFNANDFQMILTASAAGPDPITYNPAGAGVTDGSMPFDILGSTHPASFMNFFGEGTTWDQLHAVQQTGASTWRYQGFKTGLEQGGNDTAFNIWWDVSIDTDPVINVSLMINNPMPFDQTFTLSVPLVTGAIGPSTLMNGSVSGTATDTEGLGGSIYTSGVAGYQAWIDNDANVVRELIPDGTSVALGSNETATIGEYNFGFPAPEAGPAVTNQIGLRLTFTISAFDSAIIHGVFEVVEVPGPGALPMLAIAGLVSVRRRRRA